MALNDNELDHEELDDEEVEVDDDELEDQAIPDDEEEDDESSLEELLAQRAAARRGASDDDEDDDMIAVLPDEPEVRAPIEPLARIIPVKDRKEFVCRSCYLVKARTQLADAERQLCRDCV